jgi:hypothetical protein
VHVVATVSATICSNIVGFVSQYRTMVPILTFFFFASQSNLFVVDDKMIVPPTLLYSRTLYYANCIRNCKGVMLFTIFNNSFIFTCKK